MRRPGSSLLIVVLILTVVSVLTVTGARILQLNARQSTAYDVSSRARQVAQAGVEEALARIDRSGPSGYTKAVNAWGEFGNETASTIYPLKPVRRSLGNSAPTCNLPVAISQTTTSACPYYDISVRNTIAFTVNNYGDFNKQAFQPADFPTTATEIVPVVAGTSFTFQANIQVTSLSYTTCTAYDGTGTCTGPTTVPGGIFTISSATMHSIKISFTYSSLSAGQGLVTLQACAPDSTGFCAMGKGYTTAEVAGYAGEGAQVHFIIESHPNSVPPTGPTIRETSQYYDNWGVRRPS